MTASDVMAYAVWAAVAQLVRQIVAKYKKIQLYVKRTKILAARVDETQLQLLSRELFRWKMQHYDLKWNDTQFMNIN